MRNLQNSAPPSDDSKNCAASTHTTS